MELQELQHNWNELGKRDPLWAILTDPARKNRRWDEREFFKSGEAQIDALMSDMQALGIAFTRGRCLDFGCGVGRLTQALCRHFGECDGVDIAASMIESARGYNRYGARCRYHLNESNDLALFADESFDFIYSILVLQHMRPEYAKAYIREFVRTLRPGGVAAFQVPSEQIELNQIATYGLPNSGFNARISFDAPRLRMSPGSARTLTLRVKNMGDTLWRAKVPTDGTCYIRLGNHWWNSAGERIQRDDGRAYLPRDIAPGDEATVRLEVASPPEPGQYEIEFDLVQEQVAWFEDRGSPTLRVPVENRAAPLDRLARLFSRPRPAPEDPPGPEPIMELYGVPKQEVLDLVAASGGAVAAVQPNSYCGDDWNSYLYFVTKKP